MINKKVIVKSEQPELYVKLVNEEDLIEKVEQLSISQ